MLSKFFKFQLALAVWLAVFSVSPLTSATEEVTEMVEDSTVSPIADMALIESEMKTSTERPPTMETSQQDEKSSSQRHTVADFIIHPLIAFKPRNPEADVVPVVGKQAPTSLSSTTPSPWQLFGFNTGQGLGSSVSSLAGSVTGWLNDRIQLPGLMETPVRESTTSSTTSTTTTTPRPDVVVRVQHKPSTTRRPLIAINNRNRPFRPNFDSDENDDDNDDDEFDENEDNDEIEDELSNEEGDIEGSNEKEDGDNSEEEEDNEVVEKDEGEEEIEENADDDEEENYSQRPNNRRRPLKNKNNQRQGNIPQNTRRRVPNRRQRPARRRPANINDESEEEVSNDDEYNDNNTFYYGERPSTKRSQSSPNFIQRGQQQLINQIRQLTRGQTPTEIGSAIRRSQTNTTPNRRRQQATLFVNRNGQTIYMAPELAQQFGQPQYQSPYAQPIVHKSPASNVFPQPPLTVPLKQKGQPVQYITIPWSQLGISPPNNVVAITEGIQSQPYILNIPQSAINTMQNQARPGQTNRKKKRPQLISADAVPLLAEASLMDIFKPPQIPPSRTSGNSRPATSGTPVLVPAKPTSTKTIPLVQQRIRPGTIVEKAPNMLDEKNPDDSETPSLDESKIGISHATGENEYILVGKDDEAGLSREIEPAYGDARYVRLNGNSQYYDVIPKRRFTIHRGGRELTHSEGENEQYIPVEVVSKPETSNIPNDRQLDSKASEKTSVQNGDKNSQDFIAKPLTLPFAPPENVKNSPEAMTT